MLGVDLSPVAVRAAQRRYPALDARVADVLSLPFEDQGFDVVVSNSTLDHFDSHAKLAAAVGELARIVKTDGKLIITLDNRFNPIVAARTSVLFGALNRVGLVPYFVGATYGPRGLSRVLRANSLEITELRSVMHCPPQLAAALAARRNVGGSRAVSTHVRRVMRFEAMGRWPTRHLTGHFVAALAVKR